MSEPDERAENRDPVDEALDALAGAIRTLDRLEARGELAMLRRMNPEHPETSAFPRLSVLFAVSSLVEDMAVALGHSEALRRMAAVAQLMALRPDDLRRWGLGRDLCAIGMTDHRLGALLTAGDVALRDTIRRLGRRLARDVTALAYQDLGRLLILSGWREDEAEATRMKIAREVARAQRESQRAATAA